MFVATSTFVRRSLLAACGLLALAAPARAAASFFAAAHTFSPDHDAGGAGFQFAQLDIPGNNNTSDLATAVANLKHVGIQSRATSPAGSGSALNSAQAETDDTFTIAATNGVGNPVSGGTFDASINVAWNISVTPNASADFGWTVQIDSQTFGLAHQSTSGSQLIQVTVPWTAGQPILLKLSGNGFTDSVGAGPGSTADIDFLNSADWGGISGVFDSSGNPVAGFAATGSDGVTDYSTAAVPEPSTLAAVSLAAACVFVRRRKASRHRSMLIS